MFRLLQPSAPALCTRASVYFHGQCDLPGELFLQCGRRRLRCHRDPVTQTFWCTIETRPGLKHIQVLHLHQTTTTPLASRWVLRFGKTSLTGSYDEWVRRYDTLSSRDLAQIRSWQTTFPTQPSIAILLPVYNPPLPFLEAAVDSVLTQTWPHWSLCIVDDASPSPIIREYLQSLPARDPRIRLLLRDANGHISRASNDALALADDAEWITLLDHDDLLTPHALTMMAHAINTHPHGRFFYSDEDKIDSHNRRFGPYFKPDWNPALVCSHNHVTHLALYHAPLLRDLGGFRTGFEGAQDWDLVLRAADALDPPAIVHIPRILYHWRSIPSSTASGIEAKPYAVEAGRQAIADHLQRHHLPAEVLDGPWPGTFRVQPHLHHTPTVCILIPTRDRLDLLQRCVDSLLALTDYPRFVITIIDNQSRDPATLAWMEEGVAHHRFQRFPYDAPFNYAAMHNAAVAASNEDLLLFLNNDMEIIHADWLSELVRQLHRPAVGAVGARLLYPDHTIQHAGVLLGPGYGAAHAFRHAPEDAPGHNGRLRLIQDYSAVTAACLLLRKTDYLAVDGFDADAFPVAYNDIDLCLKLRTRGLRILYTPHATLLHHESASRGSDCSGPKRDRFEREKAIFRQRWSQWLVHDPAYNPNLTIQTEQFECAFPPRVDRPWQAAPQ